MKVIAGNLYAGGGSGGGAAPGSASIIPTVNNAYDLGEDAHNWRLAYITSIFTLGITNSNGKWALNESFNGINFGSLQGISWCTVDTYNGVTDISLNRTGTATLSQRSGINAQEHRTYITYTDASNGAWLAERTTTTYVLIATEKNGTGPTTDLKLQATGNVTINRQTGATAWYVDGSTGHLIPGTDNTFDIGTATVQARTIYGTTHLAGNGSPAAAAFAFKNSTNTGLYYRGSGAGVSATVGGVAICEFGAGGIDITGTKAVSWVNGAAGDVAPDTQLWRHAAGIIAQRVGTAPQGKRVYNTFTDVNNGEWIETAWVSNVCTIRNSANGTGLVRKLNISGDYYVTKSGAADPVAADIPAGNWVLWKNTTTGNIKVWANDGGTLKSGPALA